MGAGAQPSSEGPAGQPIVSPSGLVHGLGRASPVSGRVCTVKVSPGSPKSPPNADGGVGIGQAWAPLGPWQGLWVLREQQETEAGVYSVEGEVGSQWDSSQEEWRRGLSFHCSPTVIVSLGAPGLPPENLREQPGELCSQGPHPELPARSHIHHTTHQTCASRVLRRCSPQQRPRGSKGKARTP